MNAKVMRDLLREIVEAFVGPRFKTRTIRRATVVAQRADGTLDLQPTSSAIPPLTEVPIAYGDPGTRAKVKKGAKVLVEFAEGDLADPVVVGFVPGSCEEITIDADRVRLADGDMPLARRGDLVAVALPVLIGSVKYSPVGTDPTVAAYGTIISGSSTSSSK